MYIGGELLQELPLSSQMLIRLANWESLLDTFLRANLHRPFQWGEWDCGMFARKSIQVITGTDIGLKWEGTYSSREEAGKLDVFGIARDAAREFGLDECPPARANRGDLVIVENIPNPECFGILGLDGRVVLASPRGLGRVPHSRVLRSWHI